MATLIFDFDGTIADSFEMMLEIAHELTGIPRYSEAEMERLRHLTVAALLKEVKIPLYRLPRLLVQGRQQMHVRMHELKPFDGVYTSLQSLHRQGHRLLVISSNGTEGVQSFLIANKLDGFFDAVYGDVSLLNKAATLKKVMKKEVMSTDDCYYVGDEVRDIMAAKKVGIHAVSVSWGFQARKSLEAHAPDVLLDKPADLATFLTAGTV